jgi:hypothetical protein
MTQQTNQATGLQQLALKISQLGDQAFTLLSSQFRLLIDNDSEVTVAEVTGPGILKPVNQKYVVESHLLNTFRTQLTPSKVMNELYPAWRGLMRERIQPIQFDSVLPFAFKSQRLAPEQYAWQRLSFDHDPSAACPPTFGQMLERTTPDEARSLVLFIGSLFDYKFPRSQYVYLYGDGEDGKSTLLSALAGMFNKQGVATMKSGDFGDSHSTTSLERARLLIFNDQNNNSFMSTGHFKGVTGDDIMTINPKGAPRRNIRLNCKVLIASNNPPSLSGGRADERRILPVKFRKNDGGADHNWVARFNSESACIAQYCINEFSKWKAEHPGKDLPAAEEAMDVVRSDSLEALAYGVIKRLMDLGTPTAETPALALHEAVLRACNKNFSLERQVYRLLESQGIRKKRVGTGKERSYVWVGVTLHKLQIVD